MPSERAGREAVGVPVALATLYVAWGSTFIAIAVAVETLPPLLMMAGRHLLAGALILAWFYRRGRPDGVRLGRRQWTASFVVGGCLFLVGHGGLAWAQQTVPSGVAALLVGTIPLWMALVDRVAYGQRLRGPAVAGVVLGFAGLAVLVGPPGEGRVELLGAGVIVLGALSWVIGSLYSRGAALPGNALLAAAMGSLAGGVLLGLAGAARGELSAVSAAAASTESLVAVAYLVVVGSLVGFTAYVWLLRTVPSSVVATYAYVNPVVAILLGWLVLGEQVTPRMLLAGIAIVAAVGLIVSARAPGPARPPRLSLRPAAEDAGR